MLTRSTFLGASRLLTTRGGRLLELYQNHHLRQTLRHASLNSPFYRRQFRERNLAHNLVAHREDLVKLGFFTTSADLQADPFDFLAIPRVELVHLASTTGTTGRPKITFYSKQDWTRLVNHLVAGFQLTGIDSHDVAQVMFNAGSPAWMTGTLLQRALEDRGVFVVPVGNAISPLLQVEMMQAYGTTCLYSTPSYLHRVTVEAGKQVHLADLKVRVIYLGAEPTSDVLRSYLERSWGADVYEGYGMMELGSAIAGECAAKAGLHLGLDTMVEVIDPDTGVLLPDGQVGELVFTTLARKASPLIRYRSGDIACLIPRGPCPCGRIPTRRISRIQGRSDDMIQLGTGENFFPSLLDQVMIDVPGVTGFQMIVTKQGFQDHLALKVENESPSPDLPELILQRLYAVAPFIAADVFQSRTIAEPVIEQVKPGTLQTTSPTKIRRVLDLRAR